MSLARTSEERGLMACWSIDFCQVEARKIIRTHVRIIKFGDGVISHAKRLR